MKTQQLLALLSIALVGLGLGACGEPAADEAEVNIRIQGVTTSDNVISALLWAPDGGVSYDFNIFGEAGATQANFVLDISRESTVVHTVEFSLPTADVNAMDGDTGSGLASETIYPDVLNDVTIVFNWGNNYDPQAQANIDLSFHHPPAILDWSATPGSGATAGETIKVTADVQFFGSSGTVTAQFWDDGIAGYIGTPASLSYSAPIWSGTVTAAAGAEQLHLIASDTEGTVTSQMTFIVP